MLSANKNWITLNVLFQPIIITDVHHKWLLASGHANCVLRNEKIKDLW